MRRSTDVFVTVIASLLNMYEMLRLASTFQHRGNFLPYIMKNDLDPNTLASCYTLFRLRVSNELLMARSCVYRKLSGELVWLTLVNIGLTSRDD